MSLWNEEQPRASTGAQPVSTLLVLPLGSPPIARATTWENLNLTRLQGFLNPDPSLCRLMGHFCKPLALCETTMLFRIISFYQVILLQFLFVLLCLNQVTLSSCPSSHTGDHGVLGNDPEHKQQLQKRENPLYLLFLQPR